jgi:hypothetical protein
MQIALEKSLSQVNFLMSSVYEKHDLTRLINNGEYFVIRQGDLIVTNYKIFEYRKRGLRKAYLTDRNGILNFANSHFIVPLREETLLIHNEHGVIIIPRNYDKLEFYTINHAVD